MEGKRLGRVKKSKTYKDIYQRRKEKFLAIDFLSYPITCPSTFILPIARCNPWKLPAKIPGKSDKTHHWVPHETNVKKKTSSFACSQQPLVLASSCHPEFSLLAASLDCRIISPTYFVIRLLIVIVVVLITKSLLIILIVVVTIVESIINVLVLERLTSVPVDSTGDELLLNFLSKTIIKLQTLTDLLGLLI